MRLNFFATTYDSCDVLCAVAATAEFESLVGCGQESGRSYLLMARLWAEKGRVEETSRYIREAMKLRCPEEDMVEYLVLAHVKRLVSWVFVLIFIP